MTRVDILTSLEPLFRKVAAEHEGGVLPSYFVETAAWRQLLGGTADIVMGPKGSGKSALYVRLLEDRDTLRTRAIELVEAENPFGDSVFKETVAGLVPAISAGTLAVDARTLGGLWRLYFLALVVGRLRTFAKKDLDPGVRVKVNRLVAPLVGAGLLPETQKTTPNLLETLRNVLRRVESFRVGMPFLFEAEVKVGGKATRREFDVDKMLADLHAVLEEAGVTTWVLLDRLDEAFEGMPVQQEAVGLSSLLDTHAAFLRYPRIGLKLFVRDDIYARALEAAGRHSRWDRSTTRTTLKWSDSELMFVILRRMALSDEFCRTYGLEPGAAWDYETARGVFARAMPPPPEGGDTMAWIRSRLRDGHGHVSPRNVINAVAHAIQEQLDPPGSAPGECLFDPSAVETGLATACKDYYEMAFLPAQDTKHRAYVRALAGKPYAHSLATLEDIWVANDFRDTARQEKAERVATKLVEAGVLSKNEESGYFEVAPLFRPALNVLDRGPTPDVRRL